MNQDLTKTIEAVLFVANEPQKIKKLSKLLDASEEEVNSALRDLSSKLEDRGIQLIQKDDEVYLGSSPKFSSAAQKFLKEELDSQLSQSSLETLAIVAYQGPIARSKIEYIRGVNSLYTLRNLLIRGLIERIPDPISGKSYLYRISFDLMRLLGIAKKEELPDFEKVSRDLNEFFIEADDKDNDKKESV